MKAMTLMLFACFAWAAAEAAVSVETRLGAPTVARATFDANGTVELPVNYRQWSHVGTRYKPVGLSILDGKITKTPEVLNAYVEPGALAAYRATRRWPDGTQMVKEFSSVLVGTGCDDKTMLCTTQFGRGLFESGYVGLGMMVKDAKRFPDAPGHWGFFSFGHKSPPYDGVSDPRPLSQCGYCHVNLASDTDFVISRAHIGLTSLPPN